MRFYTELPQPNGVETIDDLVMAWIMLGHTSEASRLAEMVTAIYKENPTNNYAEGRCNCHCGCQHVFKEHDCQHDMKGTVVCDGCLDCHTIKVVFGQG